MIQNRLTTGFLYETYTGQTELSVMLVFDVTSCHPAVTCHFALYNSHTSCNER